MPDGERREASPSGMHKAGCPLPLLCAILEVLAKALRQEAETEVGVGRD